VGQPNERYRDANRVDKRHEVRTETGDWVRVAAAGTMRFRSGRQIRIVRFTDGSRAELELPDEVMSRVAAGAR
jgi:hypothetical protein